MANPITSKAFKNIVEQQLSAIFEDVYNENNWGTYIPNEHEIEVNFDEQFASTNNPKLD